MTLPPLPTDNLYKFISIFGLVLFAFSAYMYNDIHDKIYLKVDDYSVKNEVLDSISKRDSIFSLNEELVAEKIKVSMLEEQLKREVKEYPRLMKFYFVMAMLGLVMIGFGFYYWYCKTQYYNDLILQNESKKMQGDKEVLIHKIQFEKEFTIYQELWKKLIDLKIFASLLRPEFEVVNGEQTDDERKKVRLEEFNLAFKECFNLYEKYKPFYSEEIYEEIRKTILIANREVIEYKRGKSYTDEYWDNAEKNIDEIVSSTDIICQKIRDRIGMIKIES